MEKKELTAHRGKNTDVIMKKIQELESRKEALQFDLVAGKVKNIREIQDVKRSIAQLKTLLAERQRSAFPSR